MQYNKISTCVTGIMLLKLVVTKLIGIGIVLFMKFVVLKSNTSFVPSFRNV